MTNEIAKIRDVVQDFLRTDGVDNFTYESITSSKIFTLTWANAVSATIVVLKNGVVWASSNYTYSATTGKITVTGTLSAGDSLEVTYSYYKKYSDTELKGFIKSAIYYISIEKYGTFVVRSDETIFPTPTESEQNLISIIASILMKGDVTGYRTPELTINFERGDSKEVKIKKYIRQFKKAYGCLKYIDPSETIVTDEDFNNG
jgi:hypothetical protein